MNHLGLRNNACIQGCFQGVYDTIPFRISQSVHSSVTVESGSVGVIIFGAIILDAIESAAAGYSSCAYSSRTLRTRLARASRCHRMTRRSLRLAALQPRSSCCSQKVLAPPLPLIQTCMQRPHSQARRRPVCERERVALSRAPDAEAAERSNCKRKRTAAPSPEALAIEQTA